jgi:hypothetical protein
MQIWQDRCYRRAEIASFTPRRSTGRSRESTSRGVSQWIEINVLEVSQMAADLQRNNLNWWPSFVREMFAQIGAALDGKPLDPTIVYDIKAPWSDHQAGADRGKVQSGNAHYLVISLLCRTSSSSRQRKLAVSAIVRPWAISFVRSLM